MKGRSDRLTGLSVGRSARPFFHARPGRRGARTHGMAADTHTSNSIQPDGCSTRCLVSAPAARPFFPLFFLLFSLFGNAPAAAAASHGRPGFYSNTQGELMIPPAEPRLPVRGGSDNPGAAPRARSTRKRSAGVPCLRAAASEGARKRIRQAWSPARQVPSRQSAAW